MSENQEDSMPLSQEDHSSSETRTTEGHTSREPKGQLRRVTLTSTLDGRLDSVLRQMLELSHKATRKLISTGKVSVEGVTELRWETPVKRGNRIDVNPAAPNPSRLKAFGATLIYQDDALAVLDKPAGLLSAPLRESDDPSALQAATRLCRGPRRPRVVHWLDKDTSGLLLFARTIPSARALQEALQHRDVKRVYHCWVRGTVEGEAGYLSSVLVRDAGKGKRGSRMGTFSRSSIDQAAPSHQGVELEGRGGRGQWALTRFKVIARHREYTALEVELFTGRTHQIRIHLAELGHPIVGEWVYGVRQRKEPRLALHAASLYFTHPFSNETLNFYAPWPSDLAAHPSTPDVWQSPESGKRQSSRKKKTRSKLREVQADGSTQRHRDKKRARRSSVKTTKRSGGTKE